MLKDVIYRFTFHIVYAFVFDWKITEQFICTLYKCSVLIKIYSKCMSFDNVSSCNIDKFKTCIPAKVKLHLVWRL